MEPAPLTNVLIDDEPRRGRAKDRLYVICQSAAWLFFLGLQFFLLFAFPSKEYSTPGDTLYVSGIIVEHEVQLVNYLAATGRDNGLLINFGGRSLEYKKKFKNPKPAEIPAFR